MLWNSFVRRNHLLFYFHPHDFVWILSNLDVSYYGRLMGQRRVSAWRHDGIRIRTPNKIKISECVGNPSGELCVVRLTKAAINKIKHLAELGNGTRSTQRENWINVYELCM